MVTVLAAVAAVPAVKLPDTLAPAQAPAPPSKEYLAVPPLVMFSILNSFWQETTKNTVITGKKIGNKEIFFTNKILGINSLAGR